MKTNSNVCTLLFALAFSVATTSVFAQSDGHDHSAAKPKHNQVLVEFPGHKYTLEIAEKIDIVKTGKGEKDIEKKVFVRAYLTDAHFEPIKADVKEIRLFFKVEGKNKTYKLVMPKKDPKDQKPVDPKAPMTFELEGVELATLICDGWKGDAIAAMDVGKTPFKAKLVKISKDHDHNDHGDHDHAGHSH